MDTVPTVYDSRWHHEREVRASKLLALYEGMCTQSGGQDEEYHKRRGGLAHKAKERNVSLQTTPLSLASKYECPYWVREPKIHRTEQKLQTWQELRKTQAFTCSGSDRTRSSPRRPGKLKAITAVRLLSGAEGCPV